MLVSSGLGHECHRISLQVWSTAVSCLQVEIEIFSKEATALLTSRTTGNCTGCTLLSFTKQANLGKKHIGS